jgi:aminopeptidase YwaD
MKAFKIIFSLFIILLSHGLWAQQSFDFSDEAVIDRLKQDVYTLASDEMEGREAGTRGERLAAAYIKERMKEIGIQPMFDGSFLQEFTFPGQWIITPGNFLSVGGRIYYPGEQYNLLPVSGDATVDAPAVYVGRGMENFLGISDYVTTVSLEGKIFVIEYFLPELQERESGLTQQEVVGRKLEAAQNHGAAGVVFVNSLGERPNPRILLRGNLPRLDIPVVFADYPVFEYLRDNPNTTVSISTQLERETFTSVNVAGYWDNNAETTVVIGGHFDHLGYGGGGSRSPAERVMHPGADDNASGTAGVLEAARYLTNSDLTSNNYIFIAFAAEEKGLLGSRYFTNSDAYDMERINYMFNYDMIGRLTDHSMALIGTGTSPTWDELIDTAVPGHFNIRRSPGGMGGSDHSAFYMKDIPVIFFFTGMHEDYHRPGDTPDKVNYEGAREILDFSFGMIAQLDGMPRLEFTPTPMADSRRRRAEAVTLGLMPDLTFDGQGLRVEAVVEDRPAQKAGLVAGDVIIRIDENQVQEIQSYMSALEQLRPGQTAVLTVIREDEEISVEVEL